MHPTPSRTPSAPSSPTYKRRRTDLPEEDEPSSPAATLEKAVRKALAGEFSPKTRSKRLNQVYDIYRRKAILQSSRASTVNKKQFSLFNDDDDNNPLNSANSNDTSQNPEEPVTERHSNNNSTNNNSSDNTPHNSNNNEINQPNGNSCGSSSETRPCNDCCGNHHHHEHDHDHDHEHKHEHSHNHQPAQKTKLENKPKTAPPGVFPGKGASHGCEHYQRNCWIKAACCGKFYPCRRCHDEAETHEIDRHATEEIACVKCGQEQKVGKNCINCGVQFARYFCEICKFYDDREGHDAYHCHDCGICRVGKGIGIDNYHCNACGNCIPIEFKDSHPCKERSLDANCPICTEYLATSTRQVTVLNCGHCMHDDCLQKHYQTSYTCPICHKCVTDMTAWFRDLDKKLAEETMPPEYANRISRVFCHDCEIKCDVPFHFIYHKCTQCQGYNTAVLEQFDKPSSSAPPTELGGATATPAPQHVQPQLF